MYRVLARRFSRLIDNQIMENERGVYVKDALSVPNDIELPDYITDENSEFGVYEGNQTIHDG